MYQLIIDKIKNGKFTRAELLKVRTNAESKANKGDGKALEVIDIINSTAVPPLQAEYIFMGFCPDTTIESRQDTYWKEKGICNFEFIQSTHQLKRFCDIMTGDTIILKKIHDFGHSMWLYGHGKVVRVGERRNDGIPYCVMDWSKQEQILEVPLMGCNSTVDVRTLEVVDRELHPDFWKWLGSDKPTA